jgi:hypothetical protein
MLNDKGRSKVTNGNRRPIVGIRSETLPRYFFTVRKPGGEIEEDPHGVSLSNYAEAISYAERTIKELQIRQSYDQYESMLIVQDETRRTIISLPFLPGCA